MDNIYEHNGIVKGDAFIGRRGVIKEIRSAYVEGGGNVARAYVGLPRIGKSSILANSYTDLPANVIYVRESLSEWSDARDLWLDILEQMADRLEERGAVTPEIRGDLAILDEDEITWRRLRQTVMNLFAYTAERGYRTILVLDEYDRAAVLFKNRAECLSLLRNIALEERYDASVATISERLPRRIEEEINPGSRLYSMFQVRMVSGYGKQDMKDYFRTLADRYQITLAQEQRKRLVYYAGNLPFLLSLFAANMVRAAQRHAPIDIDQIFTNNSLAINEYYDDCQRRLEEDDEIRRIIPFTIGPQVGVTRQDEDALMSLGYLRTVNGRRIALSEYFTDTLEASLGDRSIWDNISNLEKRLKQLIRDELPTICRRRGFHSNNGNVPLPLMYEARISRRNIETYDSFISSNRNRYHEESTYLDVMSLENKIKIIKTYWDDAFARYFHYDDYSVWGYRLDACAKARNPIAHNCEEYLTASQKNEVDIYCGQIFEVLSSYTENVTSNGEGGAGASDNAEALYQKGCAYYSGENGEVDYGKALECFRQAAARGHAAAQTCVGEIYLQGRGVAIDAAVARKWFEKAARQGNAEALLQLGRIYDRGLGVRTDRDQALDCYRSAADKGSPEGQFLTAGYYLDYEQYRDLSRGMQYLTRAVEQGYAKAILRLGTEYYYGDNVPADYGKALRYLQQAAELGEPDAAYYAGRIRYDGDGIGVNYAEARSWFERAAEQGHAEALCMLGGIYQNGQGVARDRNKAFEYYRDAAYRGCVDAQYQIAQYYLEDENHRDVLSGIDNLERSAAQGYGKSCLALGQMYRTGRYVDADGAKALECLNLALSQGETEAEYDLGEIYYAGQGVPADYALALQHYQAAVDQGDSRAQYAIGRIYERGDGVAVDYAHARECYASAAATGDWEAIRALGCMYFDGRGVDADRERAFALLKDAADKGDAQAQYMLHHYYLEDCEYKDLDQGIRYLEQSAGQGYVAACCKLGLLYCANDLLPTDYPKSLYYWSLAADQGNAEALFYVGEIYMRGAGVETDYAKARDYLERSAAQEYAPAITSLGCIYYDGRGVEKDADKALYYFQEAAARKEANAGYNLYLYYTEQDPENVETGLRYLEESVSLESSAGMMEMGRLCYEGELVPQDYARAMSLLMKVNAWAEAQYYIGCMYDQGLGVKEMTLWARCWFERAAGQGYVPAIREMGNIYYEGRGVFRDYQKARRYFLRAAKEGDNEARCRIGEMYFFGWGVRCDYAESLKWYEQAARDGDVVASRMAGMSYYVGRGTERDEAKAGEYLQYAADAGDAEAQYWMYLYYMSAEFWRMDISRAIEYLTRSAEQGHEQALLRLGTMYLNGEYVNMDDDKGEHYLRLAADKGNKEARLILGEDEVF